MPVLLPQTLKKPFSELEQAELIFSEKVCTESTVLLLEGWQCRSNGVETLHHQIVIVPPCHDRSDALDICDAQGLKFSLNLLAFKKAPMHQGCKVGASFRMTSMGLASSSVNTLWRQVWSWWSVQKNEVIGFEVLWIASFMFAAASCMTTMLASIVWWKDITFWHKVRWKDEVWGVQ
jgi:hypothetical protein